MFKIEGFDKLRRDLDQAQRELCDIDGELGSVNFDPEDPASIETAIIWMETKIDDCLGPYAENPIVAPLIQEMKENYRQAILDKAANARAGGSADGD